MNSDGDRSTRRRAARAHQTTIEAARIVQDATGIESREQALEALAVVVAGIVRRITPSEANDFVSQLPSELQNRWLNLPAGPDRRVTRESVALELARHLSLDPEQTETVLRGVGIAITDLVSEGELEQVRNQLPAGFRDLLWSDGPP